jgi:hypothetical protein
MKNKLQLLKEELKFYKSEYIKASIVHGDGLEGDDLIQWKFEKQEAKDIVDRLNAEIKNCKQ